ncbi:DUF3833 domain-containing protein [Marinomonas agarivorans]|nr:DUF3833 domain-containing protein [Marinomonas agarivorans]
MAKGSTETSRLNKTSLLACLLLFAVGLTACSSVEVTDYAENKPTLDVTTFFSGNLTAHGIVKDRQGKVIRYFNADLVGTWENGIGRLEEDFFFDDGELEQRTWILTPHEQGGYIATANDVTGSGHLKTSGNALFMEYVLQIPYKGDTLDIHVDDRMYLVQDKILMNESILTKFGFQVGSVSLVILKK